MEEFCLNTPFEKSKLDVHFIIFYINKKYMDDYYKRELSGYYGVTPGAASKWKNDYFPEQRIHEFVFREGSSDVIELLKKIYE